MFITYNQTVHDWFKVCTIVCPICQVLSIFWSPRGVRQSILTDTKLLPQRPTYKPNSLNWHVLNALNYAKCLYQSSKWASVSGNLLTYMLFFVWRHMTLCLVAVLALTWAEHHPVNNHAIDRLMCVYWFLYQRRHISRLHFCVTLNKSSFDVFECALCI